MGFLPNFASICLRPTEPLTAAQQLSVLPPEVVCPQKGPLPVSGLEREERWSHRLRCAGVFLVAISCQLPLNGLQMVRKRLLGTARGPLSRGRIYNRMSVYASPDWAWLPRPQQRSALPVGTEVERGCRVGGMGTGSVGGGHGQRGKDVSIYVTPFIPWGLTLPRSKGVRPLGVLWLERRY